MRLALLLLLAPVTAMAQHGHHGHGGPHGGGSHGNPDDLSGYVGKLEDPERDAWQKPDAVLEALGLKAGQVVCDIGGGPGYFSLRAAKRVGDTGHVFAVDVEPKLLTVLRDRIAAAKTNRVTPVLALPDDPLLPPGSCDLVIVVNTYHHFPDGPAYLAKLKRLLKPGGRLANLDFHARELSMGPPLAIKVPRERFIAEAAGAGLVVDAEHTFLEYQYFVVLRAK